jgi:hypothetical protein
MFVKFSLLLLNQIDDMIKYLPNDHVWIYSRAVCKEATSLPLLTNNNRRCPRMIGLFT